MKSCLIVIIHNQSKNWELIVDGIQSQLTKPDKLFIIIDRIGLDENPNAIDLINNGCNKLTIPYEVIYSNDIPSNMMAWDGISIPFLAGRNRNIAIDKAIDEGFDNFIFIDGDCIPQDSLCDEHIKTLSHNLPIITVGRRREREYNWKDSREVNPSLTHYGFFKNGGLLVNSIDILKSSLVLWSCNFAINRNAINIIKKFNMQYYSRNEVFNSDFNGAWGGEDSFLGLIAYLCRVYITTISEQSSGVKHISHPRPSNKYTIEHKKFIDDRINDIRNKMKLKPISFDFFMQEK